jgi:hypothetical protein
MAGDMATTTLFTWGYYGWGNATPQLVEAVDAVEHSRGFAPPLFVDIRIRRNVRAKGFTGPAFERLLGPQRHCWMKSLGNKWIETRSGPAIQIADPSAAATLLDLALDAGQDRRRVLFFCSCQFPRLEGRTSCHRDTVADLVLEVGRERNQLVEVIEWPGGEPRQLDLEVSADVFKVVRRGRATLPLGESASLATFAGLPWGSIVSVRSGEQAMRVISGPAACQRGGWVLPVFWFFFDPDTPLVEIEKEARKLRREWGLEGRSAGSAGA